MRTIQEIRQGLAEGAYNETLSRLYCRSAAQVKPFRDRISRVTAGFLQTFGGDGNTRVSLFSAPGRTEIGGNHTDHQRGKVLTGSVDLDALACAAPNGSNIVRVFSEGYGMTEVDCSELSPVPSEENTTKALIRGILARIRELGLDQSGRRGQADDRL